MTVHASQSTTSNPAQPRTLRDLPGPRGLPILGNALQLDIPRLHLILEEWAATYGPLYQIGLGPRPVVVSADPELNNQILRARPDTFRRNGAVEPVFRELGAHGVFSAEGEEWKVQRRLTMAALSNKYLRNFFPTMTRVIERLQRRWQAAAVAGATVDIQKDLMCLTVDVTTNLAFGYDMNTLEQGADQIQQHLERIMPALGKRVVAPFPYWRYVKLPSDRALDRSLAVIHATIQTFIDEARQRMAAHPQLQAHPTNLLEAMLAYAEAGEEGTAPVGLSDEEIIGNVFTMLVAGEDTTANTLSWILYQLAIYPAVQQKVQAEVDAQMGVDGELDWQQIDHLPYLDAVINETLRLRPVAPFYGLETNETVELAGVQIPQGTLIYLLSRPGALLAENFAEPERFRPERWLTAAGGCPFHSGQGASAQTQNDQSPAAHNRHVHIPFGHGPRLCPGRNLALVEIKAALAMICHHFAVTFVGDPAQVREIFAFTMVPEGLLMRFTERVRQRTAM